MKFSVKNMKYAIYVFFLNFTMEMGGGILQLNLILSL